MADPFKIAPATAKDMPEVATLLRDGKLLIEGVEEHLGAITLTVEDLRPGPVAGAAGADGMAGDVHVAGAATERSRPLSESVRSRSGGGGRSPRAEARAPATGHSESDSKRAS